MTRIRLHDPVPMSSLLERIRPFPGRHLGEDELDRMQDYVGARLAPLLAGARPGIVWGLELDPSPIRPGTGAGLPGEGLAVRPGLAIAGNGEPVGLFAEALATWRALVESWLQESRAEDASGVYYLVLRRSTGLVDADIGLDPCRRAETDPRRDTRLETLGTLALRRLALSATAIAAMSPAQIQNQVAAQHLDGTLLAAMGRSVPLALLAVSLRQPPPEDDDAFRYQVDWVSQEAGRYLALPGSGQRVLLAQVQAAFEAALAEALRPPEDPNAPPADVAGRLEQDLRLDFLPAAGVLPSVLLQNPDAHRPLVRWLPSHLALDMVAVPEEAVAELIERHLPRRVVDLRRPTGERLRLLLAVNEPDYRSDLLDFPQIDAQLTSELYRYHIRAHRAWLDWRIEHDRLYRVLGTDLLTPAQVRALSLPEPAAPPELPAGFYARLLDQARAETASEQDGLPYPYSDFVGCPPTPPDFYLQWAEQVPPCEEGPPLPPTMPVPADDGLVIRYRLTQLELEGVDSRIRTRRSRLEKTRDYLLLQRQQLDAQTVSLAALGGGVAGDGSGLQVARWLPFTELKRRTAEEDGTPEGGAAMAAAPSIAIRSADPGAATLGLERIRPAADIGTIVQAGATAVAARTPSGSSLGIKGTVASSTVARARASSVELGLRQDLLDRLKRVPKQTLTKPAIEGRSYQFGVLDHIQPEVREYEAAYRGMQDLLATLEGLFDAAEAAQLRRELEGLGLPVDPGTLGGARPPLSYYDLARVRRLSERGPDLAGRVDELLLSYRELLRVAELPVEPSEEEAADDTNERYEALFRAGKILAAWIAHMEDRYARIEDELEAGLRERIRLESLLDKLAAQIQQAAQRLAGLDARRVERLGDYGVAQDLVREDWSRVHRDDRERSRILTSGLKGLYYVRVREAPVSLPLTDPLALRHGTSADPVPGCDWDRDHEIPPELADFFAAVLEVPVADWAPLAPYIPRLPAERIPDLLGRRRYRFGQRRVGASAAAQAGPQFAPQPGFVRAAGSGVSDALSARLAPVTRSTQGLYAAWSVLEVAKTPATLTGHLAETARVLSLQDLLSSPSGKATREAQTLHSRLEQCAVCLGERLGAIAPSLRLQWAQLAEDDRLDAERPERWPGLERAEAEDFNAVRTLVELVGWWLRQLDPSASAPGRAALRNFIRAAVIVSAHGDPNEILEGQVLTPPRVLAVGEPLRLTLNRMPSPGTKLQMLDDAQQVVGLLAVKDQDDGGTLAEVVRVDLVDARVTSRYTVVASRATRQRL